MIGPQFRARGAVRLESRRSPAPWCPGCSSDRKARGGARARRRSRRPRCRRPTCSVRPWRRRSCGGTANGRSRTRGRADRCDGGGTSRSASSTRPGSRSTSAAHPRHRPRARRPRRRLPVALQPRCPRGKAAVVRVRNRPGLPVARVPWRCGRPPGPRRPVTSGPRRTANSSSRGAGRSARRARA